MIATDQDRAKVAILPPLVPSAALALGIVAHLILPFELGPGALTLPLGIVFVIVSMALVAAGAIELRKAKTAFDVRQATIAIVRSGVFRISRNPVYLSMLFLYLGIALIVNSLAMALAVIPAGSALCLLVIRPEEHYLERKFGSGYLGYKAAVRRWV